jgi:hypothetical protein
MFLTAVESARSLHDRLDRRVSSYRAAAAAGQIEIVESRELYRAGGRFDGARMIEGFATIMDAAQDEGYAGLWVNADMAWALDETGFGPLIGYETDVNMLFVAGRMAAVCQYDRRLFDATTIAGVCSAHPIIEGGAGFRFSAVEDPPGLVLTGELDGTNHRVFATVLAPLVAVPAAVRIDATGVTFAGVEAAAMLARLAYLRPDYTTTVLGPAPLRRLLRMVDKTGALVLDDATDGHRNGWVSHG